MPITIISWIMVVSLIMTYIILNVLENRRMKKPEERFEKDRRMENDRRYFTYATHNPERRSGTDRRLVRH